MMALVLASEALRKFGGDSLAEVRRNRDGFVAGLGETPSAAPAPEPGAPPLAPADPIAPTEPDGSASGATPATPAAFPT
jgi:hypothetical protein